MSNKPSTHDIWFRLEAACKDYCEEGVCTELPGRKAGWSPCRSVCRAVGVNLGTPWCCFLIEPRRSEKSQSSLLELQVGIQIERLRSHQDTSQLLGQHYLCRQHRLNIACFGYCALQECTIRRVRCSSSSLESRIAGHLKAYESLPLPAAQTTVTHCRLQPWATDQTPHRGPHRPQEGGNH